MNKEKIKIEAAKIKPGREETVTTLRVIKDIKADIIFKLEIEKFPGNKNKMSHELVLSIVDIKSSIHKLKLSVSHVIDLGLLKYSTEDPDLEDDVVCMVEEGKNYWVFVDEIKRAWGALIAEIRRFEAAQIKPPTVKSKRMIQVAAIGMNYFNSFVSPRMYKMPDVYHTTSSEIVRARISSLTTSEPPPEPLLFSN